MAMIDLRRGDVLFLRVNVKDSVTSAPYSMTDWTMVAALLIANCPPVPCVISWVDQPAGVARVRLDDTTALHVGEYELVVTLTSPSPDNVRVSSSVVINVIA
jgi:hypothetical protein